MTATFQDGLPSAEYHALPHLGSTSLKTLASRTPAHYKWETEHTTHKDVFDLGTAAHSLILEDDSSEFEIVDAPNWMTKDAKAAKVAAREDGRLPLLTKDFEQVKAMRDSVMSHDSARVAFTGHVAERSIFWDHASSTPLKVRPDALHMGGRLGNLIVDLKTCASASPDEFSRTAASFGYHIQQAHYQAGLKALYGEDFDFLFVLVEKQPPYLVSIVEISAEDVARGAEMVERGIRIYRQCMESGTWPGYPAVPPISLPKWARDREEELVDG